MRVAIVGSGGVGGWLGAMLQDSAAAEVLFVGRPGSPHTLALQSTGLTFISSDDSESCTLSSVDCVVSDQVHEADPVDYILICTKTWQLDDTVLSAIPPLLHPDGRTVVLTTQNGVEAHDRVAERCGKACVLAAVTRVAAYIERPGVVVKTEAFTGGSLEIGECFPETAKTGRVARLLELFASAGITATASEDILAALWTKLVSMGSFGPVGAAARAPIDVLISLPETRAIVEAAMKEIVSVAHARGVAVDANFPQQYLETTATTSPAGTTVSTIRDVLNGSASEVLELSGAVVRHGQATNTPTPTHAILVGLLLPQERSHRGELEYTLAGVNKL